MNLDNMQMKVYDLDRFGFKAISKSTGKWVFAYLETSFFGCFGVRWSLSETEEYADYHIEPETLCQCTGLKDSVGNLIYENDIVRVADRDYTVVYHEPSMSYEINGETDDRDFSTLVSWIKQGVICTVIGNKFDKGKEMNEYLIWRDETFRVPYRIKAEDESLALVKLNSGMIDQEVNGNNLDTADCVGTKVVTIEKVKEKENDN